MLENAIQDVSVMNRELTLNEKFLIEVSKVKIMLGGRMYFIGDYFDTRLNGDAVEIRPRKGRLDRTLADVIVLTLQSFGPSKYDALAILTEDKRSIDKLVIRRKAE